MPRPGSAGAHGSGRRMRRPYANVIILRPFTARKRLPQHRLHQHLRLLLALGELLFKFVDHGHETVDAGDDGLFLNQ